MPEKILNYLGYYSTFNFLIDDSSYIRNNGIIYIFLKNEESNISKAFNIAHLNFCN